MCFGSHTGMQSGPYTGMRPGTCALFVLRQTIHVYSRQLSEKDMKPLCCSVSDAAKSIGVCRATIYNWMREGRIETSRVGGRRLVRIESVKRLVGAE